MPLHPRPLLEFPVQVHVNEQEWLAEKYMKGDSQAACVAVGCLNGVGTHTDNDIAKLRSIGVCLDKRRIDVELTLEQHMIHKTTSCGKFMRTDSRTLSFMVSQYFHCVHEKDRNNEQ